jgi:hypothetical protein
MPEKYAEIEVCIKEASEKLRNYGKPNVAAIRWNGLQSRPATNRRLTEDQELAVSIPTP